MSTQLRDGLFCAVLILAIAVTGYAMAAGGDLGTTLLEIGVTWSIASILFGWLTGETGGPDA